MWVIVALATTACNVQAPGGTVSLLHEYQWLISRVESTAPTQYPQLVLSDTLDTEQRRAIRLGYQCALLLFRQLDNNLTITFSNGGPSPSDKLGYTVGTSIVVYTSSVDVLFVVVLHELFHVFGFGALADPGQTSFFTRAESGSIARRDLPRVATDAARSHWLWTFELMNPTINPVTTRVDPEALWMVQQSRPTWTTRQCQTDKDCTLVGYRCGETRGFGRMCHRPVTTSYNSITPILSLAAVGCTLALTGWVNHWMRTQHDSLPT